MDEMFKRVQAGDRPSASEYNRIVTEVERLGRGPLGDAEYLDNASGFFGQPGETDLIRVFNEAEDEIPAWGVVRIIGARVINGRQVELRVGRPNATGWGNGHLINGAQPIAANSFGAIPRPRSFVYALYDTGDGTPAFGQTWGPG